jgi:parallel beta-helix repeat protein
MSMDSNTITETDASLASILGINLSYSVISGNHISDAAGRAIHMTDAGRNNTISENIIVNCCTGGAGYAIYNQGPASILIGNQVIDTRAVKLHDYGIVLAQNDTCIANMVSGYASGGIWTVVGVVCEHNQIWS